MSDGVQSESEISHEHDVGAVLQKFDGALWKVRRRMVDVDANEPLYELHEIDDASVTEMATGEQVAEWYDEPELVTDGGLRGPPGRRGSGSPEWEIEGGEGLPIAHDYRSSIKNDAQIWLFTCCGCGKRLVDPPGPPAGDHTCGGEWICHRFEPKEYSAIRRFNDPRRSDEL